MSEFQLLTIITSILGLVATVLNLVAFVREKDKSHTRAGILVLTFLAAALAVFYLPRYAPDTARAVVNAMPQAASASLQPWLGASKSTPAPPANEPPPLQGSFAIEIHRNLLHGIGSVVANFTFANLGDQSARVTAYHIQIVEKKGEPAHAYDRVLAEPVEIAARGTAKSEVELDPEIRDHWVAWRDVDAAERGSIEIRWDAQDAQGRRFTWSSTNG